MVVVRGKEGMKVFAIGIEIKYARYVFSVLSV